MELAQKFIQENYTKYQNNKQESSEKKVRNIIALKIGTKRNNEPEDEVAESNEYENLNLFVKRFGKYLEKKGNKGNQKRYTSKRFESNSSNFTCYSYGKQGHMKIECLNSTVLKKSSEIPFENMCKVHKWESKPRSCS